MLTDFLTQSCTISRQSSVNTDGIIKKSTTAVYTYIPCYSYSYNGTLPNTDIAQDTSREGKVVIVEPDKTDIQQGDILELSDVNIGSLGKYQIVMNPKPNYLIDGTLDSIQLVVQQC